MSRASNEYALTYRDLNDEARRSFRFEFFADNRAVAVDHARKLCADNRWSAVRVLRERHCATAAP